MFIYETASPTRTRPFVSVGRRGFERQSNVFGGKRASLIARNLRIRYPRGLAVLNYRHDYVGESLFQLGSEDRGIYREVRPLEGMGFFS